MPTLDPIQWIGSAERGHLRLLDQTRLPTDIIYLDCRDVPTVVDAIKRLAVRGAPAIGIAAAYGMVLAVQHPNVEADAQLLASSRPTAVNLFWAIARMRRVAPATPARLLEEARAIHAQDAAMCRAIGEHGLKLLTPLLQKIPGILTHCNAGMLATGGIGTATAPIYLAHERGLKFRVFADETRPLWQGARLTAFELAQAGIDVTVQCDNMAGVLLRERRVACVIVGADRIAANGDTANKIGTYSLAVLARHHGVPFFVAAPSSTFDLTLPDGAGIPIEQRAAEEVLAPGGKSLAYPGVTAFNPAFDVTPAELITAILTEKGPIMSVTPANVRAMLP